MQDQGNLVSRLAGAVSRECLSGAGLSCVFACNGRRPRSPGVSSRDEEQRGENGCSQSLCGRAVADLILRSRATHITGFLDPNRRTTVVASSVRWLVRSFGGHLLCIANNRVYTAEALMRAKADNLLRNSPAALLSAVARQPSFPMERSNRRCCSIVRDRPRETIVVPRILVKRFSHASERASERSRGDIGVMNRAFESGVN